LGISFPYYLIDLFGNTITLSKNKIYLDNAFKFTEVFGTYEYFLGIVAFKNDIPMYCNLCLTLQQIFE